VNFGYVWNVEGGRRMPGAPVLQFDLPLHEYIAAASGR
jgi:hypothetical protein